MFGFSSVPQSQHRLGIILAVGALVWSGTYSSLAKGLTPFLSPVTLLLLSEALTALFIIATFGAVPLLRALSKMSAKLIWIAILIGVLNSAIAPFLWFSGLALTTATNASLLSSIEVIWAITLGVLILHERISTMQILGMMVVLVGIGTINYGAIGEVAKIHTGDLLVVMGAIASGTGAVIFKKYLSHIMPEIAILLRNLTGIVVVGFFGTLFAVPLIEEVSKFPLEKVLLLLSFAFFSRYLTLTFFYEALDRLPGTTFSLIQIGSPLAGVVFAWLILGEQIQSYHVLGGIFIVLGLLIEQVSSQTLLSLRSRRFLPRLFMRERSVTPVSSLPILPKHV